MLPVRERVRGQIRLVRQPQAGQDRGGSGVGRPYTAQSGVRRQPHVLESRQWREVIGHLELDTHPEPGSLVRPQPCDVRGPETDLALRRPIATAQQVEAGALARAIGTDEALDRAGGQRQGRAVQRLHAPEGLVQVLGLDRLRLQRGGPLQQHRTQVAERAPGSVGRRCAQCSERREETSKSGGCRRHEPVRQYQHDGDEDGAQDDRGDCSAAAAQC